jgi:hypothetical protein
MYNALKYGYKFDILHGYTFNSSVNIFNKYITDLYKLRLEYLKSDPMNYIAKLLMNALYGRFGMHDNFTSIDIIDKKDYIKFEKSIGVDNILNYIELGDNFLVTSKNGQRYFNIAEVNSNINVAVASAITAGARIAMSKVKNIKGMKVFYSDTDSIHTNMILPAEIVSETELGKFKLERVCSKAIYLAPKVYALVDLNGKETIKIKGLSKQAIENSGITFNNLETLLLKDQKLNFNQNKWFNSIKEGNITIKSQKYTLNVTVAAASCCCNKRQFIKTID